MKHATEPTPRQLTAPARSTMIVGFSSIYPPPPLNSAVKALYSLNNPRSHHSCLFRPELPKIRTGAVYGFPGETASLAGKERGVLISPIKKSRRSSLKSSRSLAPCPAFDTQANASPARPSNKPCGFTHRREGKYSSRKYHLRSSDHLHFRLTNKPRGCFGKPKYLTSSRSTLRIHNRGDPQITKSQIRTTKY